MAKLLVERSRPHGGNGFSPLASRRRGPKKATASAFWLKPLLTSRGPCCALGGRGQWRQNNAHQASRSAQPSAYRRSGKPSFSIFGFHTYSLFFILVFLVCLLYISLLYIIFFFFLRGTSLLSAFVARPVRQLQLHHIVDFPLFTWVHKEAILPQAPGDQKGCSHGAMLAMVAVEATHDGLQPQQMRWHLSM